MATLLRGYAKQYVTADLYERVDQKLNIEVIDLPDEPFDVIVCSHVLHYVNDRKALPELKRILRNRGQMILWCPLSKAFQRTRTTPSQVPRIETTTSDTGITSAFMAPISEIVFEMLGFFSLSTLRQGSSRAAES